MSKPAAGMLRLRLPATSANLGPGFDTAAVALDFHLQIEAEPAAEFRLTATGRDASVCEQMKDNLVLDLYRKTLEDNGRPVVPIAIRMRNGIPLGMGCGSSAAGRLAAVAMAAHFGRLGWSSDRILAEAAAIEGHPDNAAACWLGGFVTAAGSSKGLQVARVEPPEAWRAIVVLPPEPLATSHARAVLPETYSRADVVENIQAMGILAMAFAQGRGELLQAAMNDRVHQPYRSALCPQLPRLLPRAGSSGILGVALSGAGPAVLAIVEEQSVDGARHAILNALRDLPQPELLVSRFEVHGANALLPG